MKTKRSTNRVLSCYQNNIHSLPTWWDEIHNVMLRPCGWQPCLKPIATIWMWGMSHRGSIAATAYLWASGNIHFGRKHAFDWSPWLMYNYAVWCTFALFVSVLKICKAGPCLKMARLTRHMVHGCLCRLHERVWLNTTAHMYGKEGISIQQENCLKLT